VALGNLVYACTFLSGIRFPLWSQTAIMRFPTIVHRAAEEIACQCDSCESATGVHTQSKSISSSENDLILFNSVSSR
jgi:hypothetical protein